MAKKQNESRGARTPDPRLKRFVPNSRPGAPSGIPGLRRFVTVNEYAALRGLKPKQVLTRIHFGPLPAFKMGGRLYVEAA